MQITGEKIILRDIQEQDTDPLNYWLLPHHHWHKLDGPYYPSTPADKIPPLVESWKQGHQHDPRRRLLIADTTTDDVLGMVTRYWISQETNWTAIGIVIYNPQNWGKGYGYEALGQWCEYLFSAFPEFVRLDLRTWSGNAGMMKLAEKLGFKREAIFRKARIVDDTYYDGLGYGVLRDEWKTQHAETFASSSIDV